MTMMIASLLTVLLSLALVAANGRDIGDLKIMSTKLDTGSDIRNMPIQLDWDGSEASDCELLCANRRECKSWTYLKCGFRWCWLKYAKPPQATGDCWVSGLKVFLPFDPSILDIKYNTNLPGQDLPGMPIRMDKGADPTDCALLCAARSDCRSWAASLCDQAQQCWLKNGIPGENCTSKLCGFWCQ